MKHISSAIHLLVLTAICATLSCCTRNNGDIGPLFGIWALREITIDGQTDEEYHDDMSWSFQNNIVWFITVGDHEETRESWATWAWKAEPEILTIDFLHGSDGEAVSLRPQPQLHLPPKTMIDFQVLNFSDSKMTLSYTSAEGKLQTYRLEKLD